MFSSIDIFKKRLSQLNTKLYDELDFDFSAVSINIDTMQDFGRYIFNDFRQGKKIYYRGERVNDRERHLLPTMLRNKSILFDDNDIGVKHIDSGFIFDYYKSLGDFVDIYNKTMGTADEKHLYNIAAFAQHYCNFSPLIDFSKSLYPALSFALKDRDTFENDIVLYTLELKNPDDYTDSVRTADKWLNELSIYVSLFDEKSIRAAVREALESPSLPTTDDIRKNQEDFRNHLESINTPNTPKAKLIDVPTNSRMRFQQGVFLLLTDFQLFNITYFTKNLREEFIINKYIISRDLCPALKELIAKEAPWYNYKYLMDFESAFNIAVDGGKF